MDIQKSIAFVSGANRGIGKAYVEALLQVGVRRIYAAARRLETLNDVVAIAPDRIIPIALDVTNPDGVRAAAQMAQDTTVLINNAGVLEGVPLDRVAPIEVAKATLQAIAQGVEEVYLDPTSQNVFANLQVPLKDVEKQFASP
jgi:NAD(P)-dependent dehydrogenase (short-subunit alcohol dehydrogenase family)